MMTTARDVRTASNATEAYAVVNDAAADGQNLRQYYDVLAQRPDQAAMMIELTAQNEKLQLANGVLQGFAHLSKTPNRPWFIVLDAASEVLLRFAEGIKDAEALEDVAVIVGSANSPHDAIVKILAKYPYPPVSFAPTALAIIGSCQVAAAAMVDGGDLRSAIGAVMDEAIEELASNGLRTKALQAKDALLADLDAMSMPTETPTDLADAFRTSILTGTAVAQRVVA
jgi:hypothetical protein